MVERINKLCYTCHQSKPLTDFHNDNGSSDGKRYECKVCHNARARVKNRKGFKSACSKYNDIEIIHTAPCEVCNKVFHKMRPGHKRCSLCTKVWEGSLKTLAFSRSNIDGHPIPYNDVLLIAKKYANATACIYCGRLFDKLICKSFDHIIPACLGGKNNPDNINICCVDCNRCKARLRLNEWIELCGKVYSLNGPLDADSNRS